MKLILILMFVVAMFSTANANSFITNDPASEDKEIIASHGGSFKSVEPGEPGSGVWQIIHCKSAEGTCWILYDDFSIDYITGTIIPPSGSCVEFDTTYDSDGNSTTTFTIETCN